MKKGGIRVIAILLICIILSGAIGVQDFAYAAKAQEKQSIAIVFDNSGSMYEDGKTAWSRATYAMEVFAAMLNEGDTISIYPMHPIEVSGQQYDMESPLRIAGPKDAPKIRSIFTPSALGTPVEAITRAHDGLLTEKGKRWLIVLTDGDTFSENGSSLNKNTESVLKEKYLEPYSRDMNVMFLGIGEQAVKPNCTAQGSYAMIVEKAADTSQVLSKLTMMCNTIFGRDTLPSTHISGKDLNLDVSMNKLIVLVQGENVSDVTLTGPAGRATAVSSYETKYPENGVGGKYQSVCQTDTSLQGMMMTYTDIPGGNYTLNYSGDASSVEVYYEPNVDMEFTFTDENGNKVDPKDLYEGNYVISFGMKDGRTGEYTDSMLIGDTLYEGHYYINDEKFDINCSDKSGSVTVPLKLDDRFNADMLVTYLGGYKIYKDSADFGWPDIGLTVKPRPAGDLRLVISGGREVYPLTTMEQGEPFKAEVYYQDQLIKGDELEKVELTWNPDLSGAELRKVFQGDYYDIHLLYKDPDAPDKTETGSFTVPITAIYTPPASETANSYPVELSYSIEDDYSTIRVKLTAEQDYYVIKKLAEGKPIRVDITDNGNKLNTRQFETVELNVDCGGLNYTLEPVPDESAYLIYFRDTASAKAGRYKIKCTASVADEIGRTSAADAETSIELSSIPRWIKLAAALLLALLLLLIIILILHIKALPTKLHTSKRQCRMEVDGEDVTANSQFNAELDKRRAVFATKYAGRKINLVMNVKPGKGSYVKTAQTRRSAEVIPQSVMKQGGARVDEIMIGTVRYMLNEETNKLERFPKSDKPFNLKNGMTVTYRGVLDPNGDAKDFSSSMKLNFKKK